MLAAGDPVGDRYEVEVLLARGGMADVYRAHDMRSGRPVALKLMRAGEDDGRRFAREAKLLAELDHPNLVRLLDVGHHGGLPYLVMELVDGGTLAERLERGPLTAAEARSVAHDVAAALAYVHRHGVVHRDLKPSNILLATGGRAMLADFGIARFNGATQITQVRTTIGTAAFLAPEQLDGHEITGAADVYALGLVLIEALTGQPAFSGTQHEMLAARVARPPHVPAHVPGGWRDLLVAMTARDPESRPAADDVRFRLAGSDPHLTTTARIERPGTDATPRPAAAPARRQRHSAIWALTALVVALAAVVVIAASAGKDEDPGSAATTVETSAPPPTSTSTTAAPASTAPTTTPTTTVPATTAAPTTTLPATTAPAVRPLRCGTIERRLAAIEERLRDLGGGRFSRERVRSELEAEKAALQEEYAALDC